MQHTVGGIEGNICGLLFQGSARTAWPLLSHTAPSPGRLYTAEETELVMPNSAGHKVCLGNMEDDAVCIPGLILKQFIHGCISTALVLNVASVQAAAHSADMC